MKTFPSPWVPNAACWGGAANKILYNIFIRINNVFLSGSTQILCTFSRFWQCDLYLDPHHFNIWQLVGKNKTDINSYDQ